MARKRIPKRLLILGSLAPLAVVGGILLVPLLPWKPRTSNPGFEANHVLSVMIDCAITYYNRERLCAWDEDAVECAPPQGSLSVPIAEEQRVFPGGPSFDFGTRSHASTGAGLAAWGELRGERTCERMRSIAAGLRHGAYWDYVYTTGPGRGAQSTVMIYAIARNASSLEGVPEGFAMGAYYDPDSQEVTRTLMVDVYRTGVLDTRHIHESVAAT